MLPPRDRRCPVGSDHQIVFCRVDIRIGDFLLKNQLYSQARGTLLPYLQDLHARDSAESVSTGCNLPPFEMHINIVPMPECLGDGGVCFGIGVSKTSHGLVREHDSPAKGTIGTITLQPRDIPRWI